METTPNAAGPLDRGVRWLPGWYATKLHAVPEQSVPEGTGQTLSLCGQWVYGKARTEWAQRKVDKGIAHCKHCERLLTPNSELSGPRPLAAEGSRSNDGLGDGG